MSRHGGDLAAEEDLDRLFARLMDAPRGTPEQRAALDEFLYHHPHSTREEQKARDRYLRKFVKREGRAYLQDPRANRTSFQIIDQVCSPYPEHLVVNCGYGKAKLQVHRGRFRALHVLVTAQRLELASRDQLRMTEMLLGAAWCGADFPFGGGSYAEAAQAALRELYFRSTVGDPPCEALRDLILAVYPGWAGEIETGGDGSFLSHVRQERTVPGGLTTPEGLAR